MDTSQTFNTLALAVAFVGASAAAATAVLSSRHPSKQPLLKPVKIDVARNGQNALILKDHSFYNLQGNLGVLYYGTASADSVKETLAPVIDQAVRRAAADITAEDIKDGKNKEFLTAVKKNLDAALGDGDTKIASIILDLQDPLKEKEPAKVPSVYKRG